MRASAIRTASTPAASSPMNVREEPRRPQIAHQPFVEEGFGIGGFGLVGEDRRVDRDVALAAAGRDDHVHAREQIGIALHAGIGKGKPRRIGADPLPWFHLALVALLRDLFVQVERCERMHRVGSEALGVDLDSPFGKPLPVRLGAFAEAGDDADAGDPSLAWRISHERGPPWGIRGSRPSSPYWRGTARWEIQPAGM